MNDITIRTQEVSAENGYRVWSIVAKEEMVVECIAHVFAAMSECNKAEALNFMLMCRPEASHLLSGEAKQKVDFMKAKLAEVNPIVGNAFNVLLELQRPETMKLEEGE